MSQSSGYSRQRTVIDTNIFVSGLISATGSPARVLDAFLGGQFLLVTCAALTAEVMAVLSRPSLQERYRVDPERRIRLLIALRAAEHVEPLLDLPVRSRDPEDDMLLTCALGSNAAIIVTGDRDLLVLDGRPELGPLRIVSPTTFLLMLSSTAG